LVFDPNWSSSHVSAAPSILAGLGLDPDTDTSSDTEENKTSNEPPPPPRPEGNSSKDKSDGNASEQTTSPGGVSGWFDSKERE